MTPSSRARNRIFAFWAAFSLAFPSFVSAAGFLDTLKEGFIPSRKEQATTSAGTRAIEEGEDTTSMATDWDAVKKIDGYRVDPRKIRSFIEEGKLSPEKKP
jgi:hypothetical protein